MVTSITYPSADLQLYATKEGMFYVTSTTPNATENNFYNAQSGFNTPISLRSCSLYNDVLIGIIEEDGADQANAVLHTIFDEINQAFASASTEGLQLYKKVFASRDEMNDYVRKKDYRERSMCFGIGWHEFDSVTHSYAIDMSYNFGDFYENRLPQTYYENSIYCDYCLSQQGNMGILQLMTTVTSRVINDVY